MVNSKVEEVMFESLSGLLSYRSMIRSLVRREIRGRYKGSILGFLWNFITPLIQILVYMMVFTVIFKSGLENYAIYLVAGLVPWIYYSDSVSEGSGTLVANGDMMKKIYFPRGVLPISTVLAKLVNMLLTMIVMFVIIGASGFGVNLTALLFLIPAIIIYTIFLIGLTCMLSAINVYLRDVQYIVTVLLMAHIWLTPIMYVRTNFDNELINTILAYNPMTYFIGLFQDILYWKQVPDPLTWGICLLCAVTITVVGAIVFKKLENDFAEVL